MSFLASVVGFAVDLAVPATGLLPDFGSFSDLVRETSGWIGLGVIFVYSFLIAFALPGVSEVVLLAPLEVGLPNWARLGLIILVSAVGKAAGSVFAFYIGQSAKKAGPVERALRRSRFDALAWSERRTAHLVRRWGYAGLALGLSVPGFPDTISIYAFSVLDEDYVKFAAATFVGSVNRLLVTLVGIETVTAIL